MKKLLVFGGLGLVLLGAAGGGGYYYDLQQQQPEDHSIIVVDTTVGKPVPPAFSIVGKVFVVPGMSGATTTLDLVEPKARRDYPMGRFTSADGKIQGKLIAYDEFVSPYFNNVRAMPIAVEESAGGVQYYLAVLEGDEFQYATSVPISDDHIKITNITRDGDQVTLGYFVHDKNQPSDDVPTVGTSAVVNIVTGLLVQAGRNPATEVIVADKFTGKYYWVSTKYADGKVVKPDTLDYFGIEFAGNSLTLTTDCNIGGATISVGAGSSTAFTVGTIDATKKSCSSQYEGEYFAMFSKVASYDQPTPGTLTLKFTDGGTMQFITKEVPVPTNTATSSGTSTKP